MSETTQENVERRVAAGEISAARTFTEMSQITQGLRQRLARAEELLSKARNQMDNPNPLSTLDERIDAFLSGESDD